MLVDHLEGRGVEIRMFGLPALANPFPAMVARRLGVPLVAGRAVRLPGSRFRIDAAEIVVPRTNSIRDDILAATQAIQSQFEAWIRERPGEWMWTQDRFREARTAARRKNPAQTCQPRRDGQRSPE
jgi:KDO2-lipid IV(A) lauroyltransferase